MMLVNSAQAWGVSKNPGIHVWHVSPQKAAVTRLALLSRLKYAPGRLDDEFPNLRSSLIWLIEQHSDQAGRMLLDYLDGLAPYLHLRGQDADLERWCRVGLQVCERLRQNPARTLLILGECQYALGRWQQAGVAWQSAVDKSSQSDKRLHAQAVFALGRLQLNRGDYKAALDTLAQANALFGDAGDTEGSIGVRSEIAAYYLNRRELDRALALYLEIDASYKRVGISQTPDHTLLMLGVVYRHKGMFEAATAYLSELYERGETQNNTASTATAAHHLAWTFLALGELDDARRLCGKALALYKDIRDPRGLSDAYEQMGAILIEDGKPASALGPLEESAQMRRDLGNQPGLVSSLRRLALAYLLDRNYGRVISLVLQVLYLYVTSGMLSRSRLLALLRDFVAGIRKAFVFSVGWHRGTVGEGASRSNSVMEKFSQTLFGMRRP
jgi:tetratricopeptide (TPR) repeat protein